jgi:lipid-A-disaccharide synthase
MGAVSIMVVAGEASGDLHGAGLCAAIRTLSPGARVFGMGGKRMRAAGVELLADVSRRATVGGTEAVSGIPALYRIFRRLRRVLEEEHPDVLVLIDFPEFNLRLARVARRAEIPVVYFVPPQIWAWRRGRIRTIRRLVSLVLAAFPFERALYRDAGVAVEFVGHPVVDGLAAAPSRAAARRALALADDAPVIGLLPGSRPGEVARMLPLMRETAVRLAARWPTARFVVAQAPTLDGPLVQGIIGGIPGIRVVRDATPAVIRAADLLLVTSGTATLEAALLGTPMVVCYKLSRTSELLGRMTLRVPWISLVNIVLGRRVVPELFERRHVTVDRIVNEAAALLDNTEARTAQLAAFAELRAQLGEPGVGLRAAQILLGGGLRPPISTTEGLGSPPEGGSPHTAIGRRAPEGALLPASPPSQDCAGKACARTRQ